MLIGAGVRNGGGPMRQLGAPLAAAVERNTWAQAGALRNLWAGQGTVIAGASIANRSSVPNGSLHPASWLMAPKPGGMASRGATTITISATGAVSRGLPVEGSANIAISAAGAATAVGAVAGSAAIALTAAGAAYGQATVSGSAAISLAAAGTIGSIAYVQGSASVSITAAATMGCTARVSGDAFLSAAAEGATLTEYGIASAVWQSLAASFNSPGTMGEKLNDAGSAANPWTEDLSGPQTAGTAGFMLKIVQQILRNKQITDPDTGVMTVYDDDGTTVLFTANLKEDAAGTQAYRGQGADRRERLA